MNSSPDSAPGPYNTDSMRKRSSTSFYAFRGFEDFEQFLTEYAGGLGANADVIRFGHSVRGRGLYCVRIGHGGPPRPGVLYVSMVHGSEFIGGDMSLLLLKWFARNFARHEAQRILSRCDVYIIPLMNPDAYERARRLRRIYGTAFVRRNARGVDLNRNFSVGFDANKMHLWSGASARALPFYRGPAAFSEPETQAFRDFVLDTPVLTSLSFHSSGRVIGYPYCHKPERAHRHETLRAIALGMRRRIRHVTYKVVNEYELVPTSGDMDDWLYDEAGVLPFLMELGHFGFLLYRPDTWLNPFAWHNMPNPHRELERVLPGALYLSEWTAEHCDPLSNQ